MSTAHAWHLVEVTLTGFETFPRALLQTMLVRLEERLALVPTKAGLSSWLVYTPADGQLFWTSPDKPDYPGWRYLAKAESVQVKEPVDFTEHFAKDPEGIF